ncbi:MAG: hypothetical protein J0I06_07045 [Planctomycetes bacterium]|nr:hypothetical protein [Planctomycetota bacterium]
MRRLLTASALLALATLATTAIGQPPPGGDKKPPAEKADRPADPTDAAIAAALVNDPDVRMAKAKIQLAEAELAKARLAVTQKVLAALAAVQQARLAVTTAELEVVSTLSVLKAEGRPKPEEHPTYRVARDKVELAKTKLAAAEAELKLLTGGAPAAGAGALGWGDMHGPPDNDTARALLALAAANALRERGAVKGPIPDRLRAALDKPVKLAEKGKYIPFQAAVEAFQKAGFDVPIRQKQKNELAIPTSDGEELPIGAWFQLFLDETPGTVMVVREYGILVVEKANAPPDAPTVFEVWKQKAPAQGAKPEPAPAPKK